MDSDIEAKTSDLEVYVNREMVGLGFSNMNLIAVFARFEWDHLQWYQEKNL